MATKGSQSQTPQGERVYRFISDPGHKETLSGRVRAACLTCRRKKIKCSGDEPCRTCQERGLVCEGLPPRTRSRRQSLYPWQTQEGSTSLTSSEASTSIVPFISRGDVGTRRSSAAPTLPKRLDQTDRHDSSSGLVTELSPSDVSDVQSRSSPDRSAQSSPVVSSRLGPTISTQTMAGHRRSASHTTRRGSGVVADPHSAFQTVEPQRRGRNRTDLLLAAQMLEQQAFSLRELAQKQNFVSPGRRQTVVFPMIDGANSSGDVTDYGRHDPVDDLALLFPGCLPTPGGATAANANNDYFSSWLGSVSSNEYHSSNSLAQPRNHARRTIDGDEETTWAASADFGAPPSVFNGIQQSSTSGQIRPTASEHGPRVPESTEAYLFSKASLRPWPY